MKTEKEIKEHIKELEKLLFNEYANDTKRAIMLEIQVLKEVL